MGLSSWLFLGFSFYFWANLVQVWIWKLRPTSKINLAASVPRSVQLYWPFLTSSLTPTMVKPLLFKPWFADWLSNSFLKLELCSELHPLTHSLSLSSSLPHRLDFACSKPCVGESFHAVMCRYVCATPAWGWGIRVLEWWCWFRVSHVFICSLGHYNLHFWSAHFIFTLAPKRNSAVSYVPSLVREGFNEFHFEV